MIVGQLQHLPVRRLRQSLFGKTQAGAPESRQPFEIGLAVLILDEDAVAVSNHQRPFGFMQLEIRIGVNGRSDIAALRRASFEIPVPYIRVRSFDVPAPTMRFDRE